ncbi:dihydropyrimidinase [Sagittula stellata]|uniref:Dihydropyrimidinase n=1 Tax=Sagittula stellata (strain ATCC 700073 / DSM 11524 / E-37) TaxID=388399 RepID=A3K4F4_SAGS3|nr:dihydropyrimidinase [Sagittula stellata]EBA07853.1 dihydropyrimidinase [Sagittula stellata E-37]
MPTPIPLDLAIRNATVATSQGVARMDIGVAGGRILQLGVVGPAEEEVDATGLIATPGGVDTHCHLDQVEPGMGNGAESLATGGRSALAGGTTSAVSFLAQIPDHSLSAVFDESMRRGEAARIDYSFHQIITEATPEIMAEVPQIIERGIRSLKAFLTYDDARLNDAEFLEVLETARRSGAMVAVHCENYHAIAWLTKKLLADGRSSPKYHAWSRPKVVEREATYRAICLAELVGTPIQIFHVSCAEVAEEIARAQARGVKVWGETCPQYLVLSETDMDRPGLEGAGFMCSPSPRAVEDQAGLWNMIRRGVIDVISSDHSAFNLEGPQGKKSGGPDTPFSKIPNGVPGVGARMPLVFSEGVSKGRITLDHFVRLTATNPAKLYGLAPRKGDISIGFDADIVLWDAEREVTLDSALMQHAVDYSPYEGLTVKGWPVATYLRGTLAMRDGAVLAPEGAGMFLPRDRYPLGAPADNVPNGFKAAEIP